MPVLPRVSILLFSIWFFGQASAIAATVQGTVSDPDGRPTPGAQLLLTGPLGVVATTVSDERGRFRLELLEAGGYDLRAALPGFRSEPLAITLGADEEREVAIRLTLSAIAESIVVSATQVDSALSRTPDSVTVVTGAELEARQVETVADALRSVPGLTVTRSGGRGALTSLFPRGGESDFTLVLVDGMRLNAFGGGFDFAHLPVVEIDRIEIVRGPQSALYGSDAIGAVVQIVTKRGGRPRAEALFEGGGFGTTRLGAFSAGSWRAWRWGTAVERLRTDGLDGTTTARGERVTNDDYRRTNLSLSGGWRPDPRTDIQGLVRLAETERGFPGAIGSDPGGTFGGVDRVSRGTTDARLFSIDAAHSWTPRFRQRAQITTADLDGDFVSQFGRSESETRRLSARLQTDVALGLGLGASAGVELQRERAGSTFITAQSFTPIPVKRRVIGYFAEARYDARARLFATGGVRVEQIRRDSLAAGPNRPSFEGESVVSVNPKLSIAYLVQPVKGRNDVWTRARFSAGTGIRPPDAFEIAFTDNPALKPERSRSVDVGVEQGLAGGAIVLDATAFFNDYDDLIVAVGLSLRDASRYLTDNIANARSRGVELTGSMRTRWGLEARVTYTWLDTEVLSVDRLGGIAPPPFRPGDALIRRPRHQGAVDAMFTRGPFNAYAQLGARGRVLDIDPSFGAFGGFFPGAGYGVINAGTAVDVTRRVHFFTRVLNVLDRSHEETLGFPALGRSALVGVSVAAGR